MSYDLKLTTACDHRIYRELVPMEDRRILRVIKPISSNSTVKVYASNNLIKSSLYLIIDDPDQIDVQRNKVVYFKDPWRSPTDNFEVTYLTLPSFCEKCVGSNYLDDVSYDVRGRFAVLRDEYLLVQNLEKFVVTRRRSNSFHTAIGTGLVDLIGTKVTNTSFLVSQIVSEINQTLQAFQSLQSQYLKTGRVMTPGETLRSIENIDVTQGENDSTVWIADIIAVAQSGKTVEFTQYLKIRA